MPLLSARLFLLPLLSRVLLPVQQRWRQQQRHNSHISTVHSSKDLLHQQQHTDAKNKWNAHTAKLNAGGEMGKQPAAKLNKDYGRGLRGQGDDNVLVVVHLLPDCNCMGGVLASPGLASLSSAGRTWRRQE